MSVLLRRLWKKKTRMPSVTLPDTNSSRCSFKKVCASWTNFFWKPRSHLSLRFNWFARICSAWTTFSCAVCFPRTVNPSRRPLLHRHPFRPIPECSHETSYLRFHSCHADLSRRGERTGRSAAAKGLSFLHRGG